MLSAAALLALGASMTSFAAGWEKDEAGVWHYYDSNDDMVTGEWKKDGGKWFYLDDDGDMATDRWIDDEYYVGSDGAMYVNQWYKGFGDDEEQEDPDDDGERWYYFNNKGKKTEGKKKIGGKTYFFDEDGKMRYGWYEELNNRGEYDVYYLGEEDEGWRAENQWLWLEKSPVANDDPEEDYNMIVLGCTDEDDCDEEGWYWFQSSGKMYYGKDKKKINGNFFMFNEHGQMLYEWINNGTRKLSSNAQLDGKLTTEGEATIGEMLWYRENGSDSIDGSRPTGWFQIDGSEDVGTSDDTKWYYIKKGVAKHASKTEDWNGLYDDGKEVYVKREKIDGKYFAFNENGEMLDGLQKIGDDIYYFNSDGYQQTGKQSNVEEDDNDVYSYYFATKNAGNGKGIDGPKDGYLYWKGKRLEADDDYKIYCVNGAYYLVNTKGKLQKSTSKKFDIEKPNGTEANIKFDSIGKKSYKIEGSAQQYDENTKTWSSFNWKQYAASPCICLKDNALLGYKTGYVYNDDPDALPEFILQSWVDSTVKTGDDEADTEED